MKRWLQSIAIITTVVGGLFGQGGQVQTTGLTGVLLVPSNPNGKTCLSNAPAQLYLSSFYICQSGRYSPLLGPSFVTSVVNDTNVTGAISANALTLGWTGALAKARQHAATAYTDQANTFGAFTQTFGGNVNLTGTYLNLNPSVGSWGFLTVGGITSGMMDFGKAGGASLLRLALNVGTVGISTSGTPATALTVNGSLNTIALATPGTPTVTPTGAAGSTAYSYVIVAKQADGSYTAGGAAGSTATGNATLNATNYNALSWSAVTNAASYDVYRTVGGATQGKVATGVTTTAYNDQGAAGSGSAPTVGTTGNLSANVITGVQFTGTNRITIPSVYFTSLIDQNSAGNAAIYSGGVNKYLQFQTNSTNVLYLSANSNVLIGTITDDATNKLQVNGGVSIANTISKYNGVSTVANGVPVIVAKADAVAQSANIGATTLYAVPASGAGMYRVSCYIALTQAATTSSTLPGCVVNWTDSDTAAGDSIRITGAPANNYVGLPGAVYGYGYGDVAINAQASSNIQYSTSAYASSGVTPMLYAIHVKLEYLGN